MSIILTLIFFLLFQVPYHFFSLPPSWSGRDIQDSNSHKVNCFEARITNTPSGKCFSIIFDLNSKIDVALLDSTYTVTKVNGKTPVISGPDEMHFEADILKIWNQTLRKYNNFELNGIEIGGLSYPTQVTSLINKNKLQNLYKTGIEGVKF